MIQIICSLAWETVPLFSEAYFQPPLLIFFPVCMFLWYYLLFNSQSNLNMKLHFQTGHRCLDLDPSQDVTSDNGSWDIGLTFLEDGGHLPSLSQVSGISLKWNFTTLKENKTKRIIIQRLTRDDECLGEEQKVINCGQRKTQKSNIGAKTSNPNDEKNSFL